MLLHMDADTLRNSLEALRTQGTELSHEVAQLRMRLTEEEQRLEWVNGAVQNLEALLGIEPNDEPDGDAESEALGEPDEENDEKLERFTIDDYRPKRTRVPSTDWVAEVVDSFDGRVEREALWEAFQRIKGIPESWKSNPRNSFNNALGRAVERNMVRRVGPDLYASIRTYAGGLPDARSLS